MDPVRKPKVVEKTEVDFLNDEKEQKIELFMQEMIKKANLSPEDTIKYKQLRTLFKNVDRLRKYDNRKKQHDSTYYKRYDELREFEERTGILQICKDYAMEQAKKFKFKIK
jgi:hypothetical protein